MIGNAISLSLLPPSVNCGQFFLLAVIALIDRPYVMKRTESLPDNNTISVTLVQCKYRWIKDYEFIYVTNACDAPNEFAILGVVSFCLALLNIILIIITGYSVNRLKDLVPQSFTNGETRRFYTKDLKEVRDNYDCVHRLKAADLATQAYQEYLRLSLVPSDAGLSAEDTDQLTADFQAVMEGIGQDRHLQTISSLANGGNTDFIAEFTRATEALAQNGGVRVGNERASNNFSLPRVSIASDGGFGRNEVQLRPRRQASCIERSRSFRVYHDYRHVLSNQATLKCGSALGAARLMHLRQLAATDEGDLENNEGEKEEKQEDSEKTISPDDPEAAAPSRFTYQQHQHSSRQSHARFWQNLLCKRSASLAMHSENHSQWPSQRTPEATMSRPRREGEGSDEGNAGNDKSFFQTELSRVPSEESNASSSEEASISVTGTTGAQIEKHHPISRSAYDVSSLLPRNRSLASVSTIGGKFEVTPTIKKPHSTKNLNSSGEKSM